MKRSTRQLVFRFMLLCVVVVFGAIAVAEAQRGLQSNRTQDAENQVDADASTAQTTHHGIPSPRERSGLPTETTAPADFARPPALLPVEGHNDQSVGRQTRQTLPADQIDQFDEPPEYSTAIETVAAEGQYDGFEADPISELPTYDARGTQQPIAPQLIEPSDETSYIDSSTEPDSQPGDRFEQPPATAEMNDERFTEELTDEHFDPALPEGPETEPQWGAETHQPPPENLPNEPPFDAPTGTSFGPESRVEDSPYPAKRSQPMPTTSVAPPREAQSSRFRETYNVPNRDTASLVDMGTANSPSGATSATGRPGPVELEGAQTPTLTLEKTAPQEVQVGKAASFEVKVRNAGQVTAHQVLVRDEIPHGTQLLDTMPKAGQTSDGAVLWQLGTIKPGDEVTAVMTVIPMIEGEIGSVATVSFQAMASARSVVTKPQLQIQHSAPRQVLVGEDVVFSIHLSNPGSGVATNVTLEEDVPAGLRHSHGTELEYEVGTLKPSETRHLELTLQSFKPGIVENVLVARADGELAAEHRVQVEVIAPLLQIGIQGPDRRYLDRPTKFVVSVANPGTAAAKEVELTAYLPKGLKFVNTNNEGHYDSQDQAVRWNLEELPAGEMGPVELNVLPIEIGKHKIRVEGRAGMGLSDTAEKPIEVEGLAAILFGLVDVTDPIEVGGQTTYEIHVVNQGSKTATNVRLMATLSAGLRAIDGNGPTQARLSGDRVLFDPLARLAPQSDTTFKILVEGAQSGDQRFRVQLISDEMTDPVIKEESTRVYADD